MQQPKQRPSSSFAMACARIKTFLIWAATCFDDMLACPLAEQLVKGGEKKIIHEVVAELQSSVTSSGIQDCWSTVTLAEKYRKIVEKFVTTLQLAQILALVAICSAFCI